MDGLGDFAKDGLLVQRRGDVRRINVLGERSSGTNFVKRLIGQNSALRPVELLGWKHGFPSAAAIPPDIAVVLCVRGADNWARSMHAKPWHAAPELQRLGFSDFIRAPWTTVLDKMKYFETTGLPAAQGQPLQYDRHPLTGAPFENLFALRRAKLQGLLSYLARDCTVVLCRMEDAQAAPEAFLDRVLAPLGHARQEAFKPVYKRLGSRFAAAVPDRPAPPEEMSAEDRAFMQTQLDPAQEAALGYSYG
ncbi:MAG: hypothetical protein AAGF60_02755 [Pseudomonadota bacterium]